MVEESIPENLHNALPAMIINSFQNLFSCIRNKIKYYKEIIKGKICTYDNSFTGN